MDMTDTRAHAPRVVVAAVVAALALAPACWFLLAPDQFLVLIGAVVFAAFALIGCCPRVLYAGLHFAAPAYLAFAASYCLLSLLTLVVTLVGLVYHENWDITAVAAAAAGCAGCLALLSLTYKAEARTPPPAAAREEEKAAAAAAAEGAGAGAGVGGEEKV